MRRDADVEATIGRQGVSELGLTAQNLKDANQIWDQEYTG